MKYTSVQNELTANEDPAQPGGKGYINGILNCKHCLKLGKFISHFVPIKARCKGRKREVLYVFFFHAQHQMSRIFF